MKKITIIIEDAGANYSAYSPDVPGCIATGDTIEETKALIQEALKAHLELLSEEEKKELFDKIGTFVDYLEVA